MRQRPEAQRLEGGRWFAIVLVTIAVIPRNVQATPMCETTTEDSAAAAASKISFAGGQLTIEARDSTLADVLRKVVALTGVKIDIPEGANGERMPVVKLGPGPTRQILAELLSDSDFDYLIQASDTDPEKIQNVLLLPREKRGSSKGTEMAAHPPRSANATALEPPVQAAEAPTPDNSVTVASVNAAAEAAPSNPQPESTQPEQSTHVSPSQPEKWNLPKVAPQPLPQALDSPSINQQLQQMYQQRMQMVQQDRQTAPVPNPGNK